MNSDESQILLPKCSFCGLKFLCEESLDRHKKSHNFGITERGLIGQYQCDIDGKYFKTRQDLHYHIRDVHCSVRRYKCEICSLAFKSVRNLKSHEETHSKIKAEMVKHIQNEALNCNLCSKSFKDKRSLTRHNFYVHPKVMFECDLCDKSYKTKGHLKRHKQNSHQSN
jgi:stress-induced morphogen